MVHDSAVLHNLMVNHKLAVGGAKSIVCLGGPRAVVAVNDHGLSIGTLPDVPGRVPPEIWWNTVRKKVGRHHRLPVPAW